LPLPPPPSRTNWTRLVPAPVLSGHVSSLLGCGTPACLCIRVARLSLDFRTTREPASPLALTDALLLCCRVRERTKSSATSARRLRRPRRARRNRKPRRRDRRSWKRLAGRGHRRATRHRLFWSGSGRRRRAVARAGSRTSTGRCERGAKAARAATTTTTWWCERGREIA
jgi:hypothetical protein